MKINENVCLMYFQVAEKLTSLFCMFGPPRILQSDNGREFVANVIQELTTMWPGLLLIHGSPRHPQSQGCVERGNGDLQLKLGKWLDEHGGTWPLALQLVTHKINTSIAAATGKTPYEVVFGQRPRQDLVVLEQLASQGPLEEDKISPDMFEAEHPDEGPQQTTSTVDQSTASEQPTSSSSADYEEATTNTVPTTTEEQQPSRASTLLQQLGAGGLPSAVEGFLQDEATSDDDQAEATSHLATATPPTSQSSPVRSSQSTTQPTQSTTQSATKRSQEYILLHRNIPVAQGLIIFNRTTLHGTPVDTSTYTVVRVIEVLDETFVPTEHNPQQEPIQVTFLIKVVEISMPQG